MAACPGAHRPFPAPSSRAPCRADKKSRRTASGAWLQQSARTRCPPESSSRVAAIPAASRRLAGTSVAECAFSTGTWLVSPSGRRILLHFHIHLERFALDYVEHERRKAVLVL